jgi:hypothetical protein
MVYDHLTAQAGLNLSAAAAWLLLRIEDRDCRTDAELGEALGVPASELQGMLSELRSSSLVDAHVPALTPTGTEAATRMLQARSDEIGAILAEWEPAEQPEVMSLIDRFARSLGAAPPELQPAGVGS